MTSLTEQLDRFDHCLARLEAEHAPEAPGFGLAFVAKGAVLRQAHRGMAHLEWPQPIAGDTRFYLASEAKPWVAALVMDAVAAGRLRLDEDVRQRLPALQSYRSPIRLGHLLRHTSGIDDYLGLWQAQLGRHENDVVTQAQALELIRRAHDVSFEPGRRHDYSNSNYVLLAELLAGVEGGSLAELAHRRYFEPWGLHHTSFEADPWRVMPRRARSYTRDEASGAWIDAPVPLATWGDGGLWSTLDDLARAEQQWQADWRANAAACALERCVAPDSLYGPAEESYRYGLDIADRQGQRLLFHGGGYAGFSSLVLRCMAQEVSLVVLSNAEGFDASATTWMTRIWGERDEAVA